MFILQYLLAVQHTWKKRTRTWKCRWSTYSTTTTTGISVEIWKSLLCYCDCSSATQSTVVLSVNGTVVPRSHIIRGRTGHSIKKLVPGRKMWHTNRLLTQQRFFATSSHKIGTHEELCQSNGQGRQRFSLFKRDVPKNNWGQDLRRHFCWPSDQTCYEWQAVQRSVSWARKDCLESNQRRCWQFSWQLQSSCAKKIVSNVFPSFTLGLLPHKSRCCQWRTRWKVSPGHSYNGKTISRQLESINACWLLLDTAVWCTGHQIQTTINSKTLLIMLNLITFRNMNAVKHGKQLTVCVSEFLRVAIKPKLFLCVHAKSKSKSAETFWKQNFF